MEVNKNLNKHHTMKLIRKIKINTTLTLLSGLHIGDSRDNSEIGAIDSPIIRRKDESQQPYIPGSSLKGKIRSLLEQIEGISDIGGGRRLTLNDKSTGCQLINYAFGFANDNLSSRIIFRDSYLTKESANELANSEFTDMPYTESKSENTIDRITGKADNPRTQERVPAGAKFNISLVINDFDDDRTDSIRELLIRGIIALNNDYLGGSGSRGYGHVKIDLPTDESTTWKEESITFEDIK